MKKILLCCLLVLLVFAVVAQAGEFDDCSYYQKNGRHNYVDDGYELYPDCTQEGIKWVKCVVCGYRGISPVARTDHKFGAWKDILPATENTKGVQSRTCSVCDTVSTQEYYPNGTVYMHRKKDVIADMQQMLVQLGYLSAATGNYDRATEDAVKKIQRKANFPIDGIAWPQTMNYLRSQVAVQGGTSTPAPQQPVYQQPVATAPAVTKAPPAAPVDRQAYCTQTDIINGMTSTIYCASHQALIESCEMMLNLAQSEMLRTEALRMYRMLLENNLKELYERWQAAAPVETKQIVVTHQAMSASYLNMQEMTWKFQYGESDIRVMENVVDALMKQCAEVCMLLGQSNVP